MLVEARGDAVVGVGEGGGSGWEKMRLTMAPTSAVRTAPNTRLATQWFFTQGTVPRRRSKLQYVQTDARAGSSLPQFGHARVRSPGGDVGAPIPLMLRRRPQEGEWSRRHRLVTSHGSDAGGRRSTMSRPTRRCRDNRTLRDDPDPVRGLLEGRVNSSPRARPSLEATRSSNAESGRRQSVGSGSASGSVGASVGYRPATKP